MFAHPDRGEAIFAALQFDHRNALGDAHELQGEAGHEHVAGAAQQRHAPDHSVRVRRTVGQAMAQRRAVEDVEAGHRARIVRDRLRRGPLELRLGRQGRRAGGPLELIVGTRLDARAHQHHRRTPDDLGEDVVHRRQRADLGGNLRRHLRVELDEVRRRLAVGLRKQEVEADGLGPARGDLFGQPGHHVARPGPAADRRQTRPVDGDHLDAVGRERGRRIAQEGVPQRLAQHLAGRDRDEQGHHERGGQPQDADAGPGGRVQLV